MAANLGLLERQDVGPGDIAHVDPVGHASWGHGAGLLPLPLCEGDNPLVRGIDGVEAGEVVYNRAKDHGRVDGDEVELGVIRLVGDKVPGSLLSELLGGAIGGGVVLVDVLDGHGVPGLLGEGGVGVVYL